MPDSPEQESPRSSAVFDSASSDEHNESAAAENERLARRVAEMESNAADVKQSRGAALNLMEGAVGSQHEVEGLNRDLQHEIVYRQRLETEERRIAERYRTLFEMVPVAVYTTDAEGVIQEFNQSAAQIWGGKPKAGKDRFVRGCRLHYPDGRPMALEDCPMARALRGEELKPWELEVIIEQKNGARRNVVVAPRPLVNARGNLIGAINCLYDLSERKRAEKSLVEAKRQQHLLYEFVQRRHDAETLNDIYAASADVILESVRCDRTSILLFDENNVMRFVYWRGLSDKYRRATDGHSPWTPDTENPRPILIENTAKAPDLAPKLRSVIKAEGIGALAFIPLTVNGKLIGKFMVYYDAPHNFTGAEMRLSQTISGQLSLAIERLVSERELREANERFRLLVDGAREYAIFMISPDNVITHWNKGAERVFGWTAHEAIGRSGELVFTPEDRKHEVEKKEIETALREGSASDRRWHLRRNGSRIWVDGVMHRLDDERTGALRGFAKIARDATAQRLEQEELERRVKERTAELTAANQELHLEITQRSRLEQEILLISEREKRQIGEELHDSLCQELAASAFLLKSHAEKIGKKQPKIMKALVEAAQTVNANVGLARDLARGLHPVELSSSGFISALNDLAYRINQSRKIECRFVCPRVVRIRDDSIVLNLYRIAQEAVNNAVKHARPSQITISLRRTRSALALEISDDGDGVSKKSVSKGMGLQIMQHRANVIGGRLTLESRTGGGTTVKCTLPGESRNS
jgi:PAS domain S-box-containing protein